MLYLCLGEMTVHVPSMRYSFWVDSAGAGLGAQTRVGCHRPEEACPPPVVSAHQAASALIAFPAQ